jgi:hypothetical protein
LMHKCGVDLELGGREPSLEDLDIALDVSLEDLRKDVGAHLGKEGLELEVRIHFAEFLDDLGSLVLGKEACHTIGNAARGADEGVLRLVVDALQAEDTLHQR